MIANVFALDGTALLLAEEGEIDPGTLQFTLHHYQLLDKYGNLLATGFPDQEAAHRYVEVLLQKKLTEGQENVK